MNRTTYNVLNVYAKRCGHELTTDRNAFDLYTSRSLCYSTHLPAGDYFYRKVFIANMFSPACFHAPAAPAARLLRASLSLRTRAGCGEKRCPRCSASDVDATSLKHVEGCLRAAAAATYPLTLPRMLNTKLATGPLSGSESNLPAKRRRFHTIGSLLIETRLPTD
jgi:hypothetical protein